MIYLHRITYHELSEGALRNFHFFNKLCGVEDIGNSAVVTNMRELIDNEKLATGREEELRNRKDLFGSAIDKGSQFIRRKDSTKESAHEVLSKLINNRPIALGIQRELCEQGRSIASTTAAETLLGELAELTKRHEEEVRNLESALEEAKRKHDAVSQKDLEVQKGKVARAGAYLKNEIQRIQGLDVPAEEKETLLEALAQKLVPGWLQRRRDPKSKKNKQKFNGYILSHFLRLIRLLKCSNASRSQGYFLGRDCPVGVVYGRPHS